MAAGEEVEGRHGGRRDRRVSNCDASATVVSMSRTRVGGSRARRGRGMAIASVSTSRGAGADKEMDNSLSMVSCSVRRSGEAVQGRNGDGASMGEGVDAAARVRESTGANRDARETR
jgi:hypothetical protein